MDDEKFIQERLAHDKSEAKLFEKLLQLQEENEELRRSKDTYYLQTLTDEKTINDLLTENKELKEWKEANKPTVTCKTCTEESVEELNKLRTKLKKIEKYCHKISDTLYPQTNPLSDILEIIWEE